MRFDSGSIVFWIDCTSPLLWSQQHCHQTTSSITHYGIYLLMLLLFMLSLWLSFHHHHHQHCHCTKSPTHPSHYVFIIMILLLAQWFSSLLSALSFSHLFSPSSSFPPSSSLHLSLFFPSDSYVLNCPISLSPFPSLYRVLQARGSFVYTHY